MYYEDQCPRCHVRRTRQIDKTSSTYFVTMAAACPDKDQCEREMMDGFVFKSDPSYTLALWAQGPAQIERCGDCDT
jgi:hypothetical protein